MEKIYDQPVGLSVILRQPGATVAGLLPPAVPRLAVAILGFAQRHHIDPPATAVELFANDALLNVDAVGPALTSPTADVHPQPGRARRGIERNPVVK